MADDYKVTPKLTLNLGLRHDIWLPYTEANDHFTFLDPTAPNPAAGGIPGALRFGGNYAPDAISCHCSQIIKTDNRAFGPRVGFAYSFNDKTVFRGGYGIMYTRRGAVGGRENARTGTGFTGINANAPIVSPNGSFTPALFWESGIPAFAKGPIYDQTYQSGFATGLGSGGTLTYGNPDSVPPRYTNWNLSVQRSLTTFVSRDCGLRGKHWQIFGWGRPGQVDKSDGPQIFGFRESAHPNSDPGQRCARPGHCTERQIAVRHFLGDNRSDAKAFPAVH